MTKQQIQRASTSSYGQVMLVSGVLMLGTWQLFTEPQLGQLIDDKGLLWWLDLNAVVGFAPQPPPPTTTSA